MHDQTQVLVLDQMAAWQPQGMEQMVALQAMAWKPLVVEQDVAEWTHQSHQQTLGGAGAYPGNQHMCRGCMDLCCSHPRN